MEKYTLAPIRNLAAQLKRGPKRLRLQQLLNIEFLLTVVSAEKSYPYEFVCHALTGYRPTSTSSGRLLDGNSLIGDLIGLAEGLSEDANMPADGWHEPVHTVAELAKRFAVSTKTIFRWRGRGLVGWRFRLANRRTRLMFPERCLRRFVAQNTDLVTRGSSFSQLSKAEREKVVAQAAELVESGQRTVNSVARIIAEGRGRAVETIRLILKHHDEAHPRTGVFNRSPLRVEADDRRLAVWEAHLDGATVAALAERFEQPAKWVYETITEMRARDMRVRKVEFIDSEEFTAADAEATIMAVAPDEVCRQTLSTSARRVPAGLPPYLAHLFSVPLLTREGEVELFRRMNYLKFKAARLVANVDPETVSASELDRIEELLEAAMKVKNEIVRANLRLVVSIAKRHVTNGQDIFELISDGNISLMRAVEKFDYSRGFKFSTYGSWALMKNFARSVPQQRQLRERYQTGRDELLESIGVCWPDETESDYLVAVRSSIERMLDTLDGRERSILRQRFGLDDHGRACTLEQIGNRFGVSKERIRQIESRAMTKLRGDFAVDVEQLLGV